MTIPVGVEGKVSNGGYPDHRVRVEDDAEATGGFLIHEWWRDASWPNGQGAYDSWVEDEAALAAYFAEAGWKVEWATPTRAIDEVDFHDATLLAVRVDWTDGCCVVDVKHGNLGPCSLVFSALTQLTLPRKQSWGPSGSIDELSVQGKGRYEIRMQSGDTIGIDANAATFSGAA
jgi:hypothetical protein